MEKKQIILPIKKYFDSPEEDLTLRVNLSTEEMLIREDERNIILDLSTQFEKERNDSKIYDIHGKIKMVFRNTVTGDVPSYTYLKDRLYLNSDGLDGIWSGSLPYEEFAILRNDFVRQTNTTNSGSTLNTFSQNLTLNGSTGHTFVTAISAPYHNWNLYLSYVYSGDSNHQVTYTLTGNTYIDFTAGDGIPFRVISDDGYYKLVSPVEHGMSEGEYIIISGQTLNNTVNTLNRTYYIDSLGDDNFRSERFVINLLKSQFSGTTLINQGDIILGKRCLDIKNISGTTSQYYVHKLKTLTSIDDYILDNIGFESPVWEEEKKILYQNYSGDENVIVQGNRMESLYFGFKKPFILSGITNNMGYTPTEVYLSVIFRNGNGFFNYPPKVGYKFHFHNGWIDRHWSGTTSNENISGNTFVRDGITFKSGTTLSTGSVLTGAFVEYNDIDFQERIISEAYHKITIPPAIFNYGQTTETYFSGSSVNNPAGYFYQPHHRIKLRQLSPYVEKSNTRDVYNLPENVKYDEQELVWKWRDLYDHGYIDTDGFGTNFPYINNMHYVSTNLNFYLRNEKDYTNKTDGLTSFSSTSDSSGNPINILDC